MLERNVLSSRLTVAVTPNNFSKASCSDTRAARSDGAIKDKPGRLEAAHGGSILLDEISDLSVPLQTKLLHFIKEQSFERMGSENTITVDARIIAASSHDLVSEVAARRFREDLYYRLGVITLRVPALRERPGDILPLATRMLAGAAIRNHRHGAASFSRSIVGADALSMARKYP